MGIFTRMRDIISSNINAMLERAEEPEKLIRLMLQEMEDTLIEIKAQCAGAMAQGKTCQRQMEEVSERATEWEKRATLAMEKNREDLAREALLEKRRYEEQAESLEKEKLASDAIVEQYQEDIRELEAKMESARQKQKNLAQRHRHASSRKQARQNMRRVDSSDVMARFEGFERRVDRMESEADLVNYGRRPSIEEEFANLDQDGELEAELEALKQKVRGGASE